MNARMEVWNTLFSIPYVGLYIFAGAVLSVLIGVGCIEIYERIREHKKYEPKGDIENG